MSLKITIKLILLKIRLRRVNHINLHAWTHIGKYTLLKTDKTSTIEFNDHVVIDNYVMILAEGAGSIVLGKHIFIGDYSTIRATKGKVSIGSNTMIAQQVKLISTNHYYKDKSKFIHEQDIDILKIGITIGDDCWLGAGCVILPGVTLGNGVVVGANAVVTKNVPDYAVVVGIPAKIITYRN
jgi:acetyltransferase-like isoleucine patch superfamily enzyme